MEQGPFGSPQRPQPPGGTDADLDGPCLAANTLSFRTTNALEHAGHVAASASAPERINSSNSFPHASQTYSYIGIGLQQSPSDDRSHHEARV